ncbi:MAG: hypothetical protein ACP5QK_07500 [Myxococcota bacterium]
MAEILIPKEERIGYIKILKEILKSGEYPEEPVRGIKMGELINFYGS